MGGLKNIYAEKRVKVALARAGTAKNLQSYRRLSPGQAGDRSRCNHTFASSDARARATAGMAIKVSRYWL